MSTLPSRQTFEREDRLRRSADYLRCYRRGGKRHGSLLSLHFSSNGQNRARLGITASRKVGKAVARHRCKRRVREIWRCWSRRPEMGCLDIVVHLKPTAATASFEQLQGELTHLLRAVERKSAGTRNQRRRARSPRAGE